jgi:predicted SAM-dependent methyltransferase
LHGLDFGSKDDGFDKKHCTLRPKDWWLSKFKQYAPEYHVEIVDKEELEKGDLPSSLYDNGGKVKLNIGCGPFTMFHHGWVNIDIGDFVPFANHYKYNFMKWDVKNGLQFNTEAVDFIFASHFLEHLTYEEGLKFLRECRRILKPEGGMRIIVPDAEYLMNQYIDNHLSYYDDINDDCAAISTQAGKLHSLLYTGHASIYDEETLLAILDKVNFNGTKSNLNTTYLEFDEIRKEIIEIGYDLSLFMEARPQIG